MPPDTTDAATQPWAVAEADYPERAGAAARLRFLLGYAILAPSGHNTQPWLFRTSGDVLEVRADRRRVCRSSIRTTVR